MKRFIIPSTFFMAFIFSIFPFRFPNSEFRIPLAHAQSSLLISYKGYLTDLSDEPMNLSISMTFRLYDVPEGGTLLWEETQYVIVDNGWFCVQLVW